MTKKTWIIFGVICVAVIGGLIALSRQAKIDVSDIDSTKPIAAESRNGNIADHVYGNKNSKVILVEYGDYQCPGCGSAYPIIKQVVEKYKDQIGFVFRNFPLTTIHPNALAAASAAEFAGQKGKFWEMHDQLYENQNSWNSLNGVDRTNYFVGLGTGLGLNGEELRTGLNSANIQKKIAFDQALGTKTGVTSTPSFFIGKDSVGDKYFAGDKLVESKVDGAQLVWSDATAFEKLIIVPALKAAGIEEPKESTNQ